MRNKVGCCLKEVKENQNLAAVKSNDRESNIELLRIILMTFIVFGHFLSHGILRSGTMGGIFQICYLLAPLYVFHVNCFVFISGFYGIHLKTARVVRLLFDVLFYSLVSYLTLCFVQGYSGIDILSNLKLTVLFPLSSASYWFITDYFMLMILSPLFNMGIEYLPKRKIELLLIILLLICSSGLNFVFNTYNRSCLFITIYLIGRYLHKYPIRILVDHPIIIWALSTFVLLSGVVALLFFRIDLLSIWLFYTNPLIILSAISFFYFFKSFKIGSIKIINMLSAGCLASYLYTDSNLRTIFNVGIANLLNNNFGLLFVAAFGFVIFMCAFEIVRNKLFEKLTRFIIKLMDRVA